MNKFDSIVSNINQYGFHYYVVSGGPVPRFSYTIGLSDSFGAEMIIGGAYAFLDNEIGEILNSLSSASYDLSVDKSKYISVGALGNFSMRFVHESWSNLLMLGALDYYQKSSIAAWQVFPDDEHWTADIPDMSKPFDYTREPIWKWMQHPWEFSVPENSIAITNMDALRGGKVTEAARWEIDQWELFSGQGPEVKVEDIRTVPLATLVGLDSSLEAVLKLSVGSALWRDKDKLVWQEWKTK